MLYVIDYQYDCPSNELKLRRLNQMVLRKDLITSPTLLLETEAVKANFF